MGYRRLSGWLESFCISITVLLTYIQFVEIIKDVYFYTFFCILLYISKNLLVKNFNLRFDSKFYTPSVTQFKLDSWP